MGKYYGIDLGTTNTLVYMGDFPSIFEDGEEQDYELNPKRFISSVNNTFCGYSMPSVALETTVPDDPTQKKLLVGHDAYANMAVNNNNSILYLNTKRYTGQDEEKKLIGDYTPSELATEFLKKCAAAIVGRNDYDETTMARKLKLVKVCITKPASYNIFAGAATEKAAKDAGFKHVVLLEEPQAALLSFLHDMLYDNPAGKEELFKVQSNNNGKLTVLVIDIGGGTTDVRIQSLQIGENEPEEKRDSQIYSDYVVHFYNSDTENHRSTANNYHGFGGLNFDNVAMIKLMDIVEKLYYEKSGGMSLYDLEETDLEKVMTKVMTAAETYKKGLSEVLPEDLDRYKGVIFLNNIYNDVTLKFELAASDYISWVQELCEKTDLTDDGSQDSIFGIVEHTIQKSGYKLNDFSYVYITGGMSKYPPLKEMFKEKFENCKAKLCFSHFPLDDIARGAACYGNYFTMDVPKNTLNTNYYIDNPCGAPILLAKDGTELPIPTRTIEKFMTTLNPVEVEVSILSGYGLYDPNLRVVKKIKGELITPDFRGTDIDVRYSIAENQALSLDLIVKHAGREPEVITIN